MPTAIRITKAVKTIIAENDGHGWHIFLNGNNAGFNTETFAMIQGKYGLGGWILTDVTGNGLWFDR